jgi:cation diffusion facilitator CzcD-associated flavoprotein CzcO
MASAKICGEQKESNMSKKESGWSVATLFAHFNRVLTDLRAYIEQRFSDSDKAVQAALQAAKEAVIKAELAAEKRFDAQNEFREQLKDQAATFMPRAEYSLQYQSLIESNKASIERLDEKIAANTAGINMSNGGATTGQQIWDRFLSVAAILVSSGAVIAILVIH